MHYIVFDLEFNQNFSSIENTNGKRIHYPFEIIQIGAIKLDSDLNTVATFNRLIKPTIYSQISPFITELTGITTEQLQSEETFPEIYKAFLAFINDPDPIFCIWGMSDIKELFRNVEHHQLNGKLLSRMYINLQPYVPIHLDLSQNNLIRLRHAVEALNIPITHEFHNALHDAFYTAEIFIKIINPSLVPRLYDPSYVIIRPRQPKREIDVDKLLQQFEKMYARKMTVEEQAIIQLAYKMGKTNQFLK